MGKMGMKIDVMELETLDISLFFKDFFLDVNLNF